MKRMFYYIVIWYNGKIMRECSLCEMHFNSYEILKVYNNCLKQFDKNKNLSDKINCLWKLFWQLRDSL